MTVDDARRRLYRRRRAGIRACTIWGWVQSRDRTSYLRGGFGPKNATSAARRGARSIVLNRAWVPGRAEDASLFSTFHHGNEEKKLRRQKQREHQRKQRIGATRVQRTTTTNDARRRGERVGDARAPRTPGTRLSYHERRIRLTTSRDLNEEKQRRADHHHNYESTTRKYSDRDRSGFRFVDARAAPLVSSRLVSKPKPKADGARARLTLS